MKKIEVFDNVLLKDGREGAVVEILGEQDIFIVDVGSSPSDWDSIEVKLSDIDKIIPQ